MVEITTLFPPDPVSVGISQIIELATGSAPTSAGSNWTAYVNGGGSLESVASAFVASTMFANDYNGGTLVNPNSSPAAATTQEIIGHALGSATSSQVNAWVNSGMPVAKVFEAFALGDQFSNLEAGVNDGFHNVVISANPLTGATTQGGTSISGINIPALNEGPGWLVGFIGFGNPTTETLANPSGSRQVDVSSANSLAQALDLAAADASLSQPNDLIPANTGVFDWFQYGGNNYIVEAINPSSTPEAQTALTARTR
jgi:hypothetical protein